jgi:UDP-glucose 4-epimerase
MATLVTGGLGFIGLHTARRLLDAGEELVLTQYRVARNPDFIAGEIGKRAHVEQLDVMNADQLMALGTKYKIDKILHLAVPALAQLTPKEDFDMNTTGLINILEAARTWEVKRLGLASSIAVYSGLDDGPFKEDMPLRVNMTTVNPTEAYKKTFEIIGSHYAQRTGVETIMLRIGGIYGPLYHSMANLPSRLVHAALKGEAPPLRGNEAEDDGNDACYVKDCAQGLSLLMTTENLPNRCYNIASGRVTTYKQIVDAVAKQVPGFKADLKPGGANKPNNYLDITRLQKDTGYNPEFPIEKAIEDYVAWLKAGNAQ